MTQTQINEGAGSLVVFENEDFGKVRTLLGDDGEPWFVAKDVCEVLGIRTDTLPHILDEDEIMKVDPNTIGVKINAPHGMAIINESGLYSLILRSRKSEAKRFKKWVTKDVLPSIRKTGGYGLEQSPTVKALEEKVFMLEKALNSFMALQNPVPAVDPESEIYKLLKGNRGSYTLTELSNVVFEKTQPEMRELLIDLNAMEKITIGRAKTTRYVPPTSWFSLGLANLVGPSRYEYSADGVHEIASRILEDFSAPVEDVIQARKVILCLGFDEVRHEVWRTRSTQVFEKFIENVKQNELEEAEEHGYANLLTTPESEQEFLVRHGMPIREQVVALIGLPNLSSNQGS